MGLLSFRKIILKQDIPAEDRKLSAVFRSLQSPPQVDIDAEPDELGLNVLGLDSDMVR